MMDLGTWITDGSTHPFYARKQLTIDGAIASASAKVCGLGQFVFWVNGEKVDDHELDPGWTDYRKLIEYVTFDISRYLTVGNNVLGAEIGNGWFIKNDEHYTFRFPEFMPPNPNPYRAFGGSLVLALEIEIVYADGRRERIHADDSFRTQRHPVVQSNVFGSETIDNRLMQNGWSKAGFDDSAWPQAMVVPVAHAPTGRMIEQLQPPVKVIRSYPARRMHTASGRAVYDLGQNIAGILELEAKGKAGDAVRIYPAEKLRDDGDVDQVAKNWTTVDSVITCIIGQDDVWESFRMTFTYFAGKVLAVETDGESTQIRNLTGHAITSAWERTGSFCCDDERYMQIYDMIEKTVEANMVSVHTDCPTIERFAWQEQNHLMAPAVMYMKDGSKLWEKFLLDMRVAQHRAEDVFFDLAGKAFCPGEGLIPSQCPCYIPNVLPAPGLGSFYDVIPWGSSCILSVRWHYMFYGDRRIVEKNYDTGMRYLAYLKTKVTDEGFINHGLGDWGNPEGELARENIETAFLYADAVTLAWFALVLGKPDDRGELLAYAEQIKNNYNDKLLVQDENGKWCYGVWGKTGPVCMTQACEAIPLYWNMVPQDKIPDVVDSLRRTLEAKRAFVAGEVGLPYTIQAAARYGMNELISVCILRQTHPSYYAFIKDGMTTLGEYWESNPRSHCHDMMGHIVEWYYNGLAGIIPNEPGFIRITVRPYLPASMDRLQCAFHSAAGEIRVAIRRGGDRILLEVNVPKAMACRIDTAELERTNPQYTVAIAETRV